MKLQLQLRYTRKYENKITSRRNLTTMNQLGKRKRVKVL